MSAPTVPPPQYSDSPSPTTKSYGTNPAAAEPLLAAQRGYVGSSQNPWMGRAGGGSEDGDGDGDVEEGRDRDAWKDGGNVEDYDKVVRMGFIRKVYSILLVQLVSTAAISALLHLSPLATSTLQRTPSLIFIPLIGSILALIGVSFRRHSYPSNLILLGAFTVCEAVLIGAVTSYMEGRVVLQALVLTSGVFLGLTLFTVQSKWDFSSLGPFLSASLFALIAITFLQIFLPFSQTTDLVVGIFGTILFSGYIVYDTFNIMKRLSPDEYIFGALSLYLDVINLFLYILRVLNNGSRD